MFSDQPGKHVQTVLVALATLALTSGISLAAVTINFEELPNEGGIHLTGTASDGTPIDITKANSETFRISAPNCTSIPGCNPDTTLNQIGTASEFLVNILESAGGPLSDQVWVHRISSAAGSQVIDFISDNESQSSFVAGGPNAIITTMIETGSLQLALTYPNQGNEQPVSISILSDVESVPEPTALALIGAAALGIATVRRRRPKLPAA